MKAACAPALVDEVDVLAYLIADALGRPILHPDDTNAVGKRVASCAKRVVEVKLRDARKKGLAYESVFATPYPALALPARTIGAKRKEPEPPSRQEQVAAARAEWEGAEAVCAGAEAEYERAVRARDKLPLGAQGSQRARADQRVTAAIEASSAAGAASLAAMQEMQDAQTAARQQELREQRDERKLVGDKFLAAREDQLVARLALQFYDGSGQTWGDVRTFFQEGGFRDDSARMYARVKEAYMLPWDTFADDGSAKAGMLRLREMAAGPSEACAAAFKQLLDDGEAARRVIEMEDALSVVTWPVSCRGDLIGCQKLR
jgi:hypothetical protein